MIKVSKILTAGVWIHVWMDPEGNPHDAGDSHSRWAANYLMTTNNNELYDRRGAYEAMFELGWIRLGARPSGVGYLEGFKFAGKSQFRNSQEWVRSNIGQSVTMDIRTPRICATLDSNDYVAASSDMEVASMSRGVGVYA